MRVMCYVGVSGVGFGVGVGGVVAVMCGVGGIYGGVVADMRYHLLVASVVLVMVLVVCW